VKNACGDVANQVLTASLAKSNGEGCTAEQTLRFRTAILLADHCFKID
jgi:hypothetical protein